LKNKVRWDMSLAFWVALAITAIAQAAFFLKSRFSLSSFWYACCQALSMLGIAGILPGVMISGVAKGSSHGGDDPLVILLIATPINVFLYWMLTLGIIKVVRRIRSSG